MKIIITGGTGFLGSKIVKRLIKEGYQVVLLKRKTSNCSRIEKVLRQCRVYHLDAKNASGKPESLEEIFQREQPDGVIHCAVSYGRKDDETVEVAKTNLLFGLELLESASKAGCKFFINTGSYSTKQLAYGRVTQKIYMADYTLSKYQFICWGEEFASLGKIRFYSMDLEHIFGEDDVEGKFIRYVEHSCIHNVPKLELSDGLQERDYIYSENVVDAYMTVIENVEKLPMFQQFQVGMGYPVTLKEFVTMIARVAESKTELCFGARPRNDNEPSRSVADIGSLEAMGWKPRYSREEGVAEMMKRDKEMGLL